MKSAEALARRQERAQTHRHTHRQPDTQTHRHTDTDKWNSVWWHDLSQSECVGACVTSAVDKCALCKSEMYTQIVTHPKLCTGDRSDMSKFTLLPKNSATDFVWSTCSFNRFRSSPDFVLLKPHQLSNLRLTGRILMDCTLPDLAELLVELLAAILLLDDVCKHSEVPLDFAVAHYKDFRCCFVGFLCCQLVSRHTNLIGLLLNVRLLLLLLLLLVLCELSWSPAVFCVLTVQTPVTNIWIEAKSEDTPRLAPCTSHLLQPC